MAATVLTVEAAKAANIEVILNQKYTQALHENVVAIRAARRSGSANTKTKAEVNLSGSKPWKQKGTGRARAGYKSSPVWVGGGVVFGPKPRDYSKKVNKKTAKIALRKAFSERVKNGDVLIVKNFEVPEGKTQKFVSLLQSISSEPKTLVIGLQFDEMTLRSARNVQDSCLKPAISANCEDLLRYKKIVVTQDGLSQLAQRMAIK
jgi:large subunit ribosomal protein L4